MRRHDFGDHGVDLFVLGALLLGALIGFVRAFHGFQQTSWSLVLQGFGLIALCALLAAWWPSAHDELDGEVDRFEHGEMYDNESDSMLVQVEPPTCVICGKPCVWARDVGPGGMLITMTQGWHCPDHPGYRYDLRPPQATDPLPVAPEMQHGYHREGYYRR